MKYSTHTVIMNEIKMLRLEEKKKQFAFSRKRLYYNKERKQKQLLETKYLSLKLKTKEN